MPNDHYTDTACAPHITEHGTCATCGAAWDPEPCPGCGGHAYHEDGCPTMVRPAPTRGARSDLLWGARWALHEARWAAERGRPLDKPLPEDDEIIAAFPTRSKRHDLYQEAVRLVGARSSKAALVALVTWLLLRIEKAKG